MYVCVCVFTAGCPAVNAWPSVVLHRGFTGDTTQLHCCCKTNSRIDAQPIRASQNPTSRKGWPPPGMCAKGASVCNSTSGCLFVDWFVCCCASTICCMFIFCLCNTDIKVDTDLPSSRSGNNAGRHDPYDNYAPTPPLLCVLCRQSVSTHTSTCPCHELPHTIAPPVFHPNMLKDGATTHNTHT